MPTSAVPLGKHQGSCSWRKNQDMQQETRVYSVQTKTSLFSPSSFSLSLPSFLPYCYVLWQWWMGTQWFTCKTKAVVHTGLCVVITDHYTNHRDTDRKGKRHCCTMVTQTCCRPRLQYPPLQAEATARHLKGPRLFPSFHVSVSPILGRRLGGVIHSKATIHPEEMRILLHIPWERQKLRNTCTDIQQYMILRLTLSMTTMI